MQNMDIMHMMQLAERLKSQQHYAVSLNQTANAMMLGNQYL